MVKLDLDLWIQRTTGKKSDKLWLCLIRSYEDAQGTLRNQQQVLRTPYFVSVVNALISLYSPMLPE